MLCFVKINSTLFNLLLLFYSLWLKTKFSCPSLQLLTFEASTLNRSTGSGWWGTLISGTSTFGSSGCQLVQIQMGVNIRHRAYTVGSEHKKKHSLHKREWTHKTQSLHRQEWTHKTQSLHRQEWTHKTQSLHRWEWTYKTQSLHRQEWTHKTQSLHRREWTHKTQSLHRGEWKNKTQMGVNTPDTEPTQRGVNTQDTEPTQMGMNTRNREWTHKTQSLHRWEWIHKTHSERIWGWQLGCWWSQLAGHKWLTDLVETSAEQLLTVDDALIVLLHLDDASHGLDQQPAPRNRIPA